MGYKDVCLNCRKAFNRRTDINAHILASCPECGENTFEVNQKFKPPKKSDIKKWKVVKYLIDNGFTYDHAFKRNGIEYYGKYPETMKDAEEFVKEQKKDASC